MDQCTEVMRFLHFSSRTIDTYLHWIRRFIVWHGKRHPKDMGAEEVRSFLSHLAVERNVGASTQNQALNALMFMYQDVLGVNLEALGPFARAKRPTRVPTVLTREEVARLWAHLEHPYQLIGRLLYGSGLRLLEGLRLREIGRAHV